MEEGKPSAEPLQPATETTAMSKDGIKRPPVVKAKEAATMAATQKKAAAQKQKRSGLFASCCGGPPAAKSDKAALRQSGKKASARAVDSVARTFNGSPAAVEAADDSANLAEGLGRSSSGSPLRDSGEVQRSSRSGRGKGSTHDGSNRGHNAAAAATALHGDPSVRSGGSSSPERRPRPLPPPMANGISLDVAGMDSRPRRSRSGGPVVEGGHREREALVKVRDFG